MSGECDECGEHATDCQCNAPKKLECSICFFLEDEDLSKKYVWPHACDFCRESLPEGFAIVDRRLEILEWSNMSRFPITIRHMWEMIKDRISE